MCYSACGGVGDAGGDTLLLCMLDVLDVMRCVLLCLMEVSGMMHCVLLRLLEVAEVMRRVLSRPLRVGSLLEVPEVIRCVLTLFAGSCGG